MELLDPSSSFECSIVWSVKIRFFIGGGGCGGDVDVLIFKILCFACVPFCFALVLSHHRIV